MSASTLALTSLAFTCLGIVLGLSGWGLALLVNAPKKGGFELRDGGFSTRVAYIGIVGGGFSLGVAVIAIIAAGVWWSFSLLFANATPGKLALICLAIGPAPLLFTALSSAIAALIGGTVDASGTRNCVFLGLDLGPLLHALFMAYWLVFVSAGLAFLGLMGSGIWAIFRLF